MQMADDFVCLSGKNQLLKALEGVKLGFGICRDGACTTCCLLPVAVCIAVAEFWGHASAGWQHSLSRSATPFTAFVDVPVY